MKISLIPAGVKLTGKRVQAFATRENIRTSAGDIVAKSDDLSETQRSDLRREIMNAEATSFTFVVNVPFKHLSKNAPEAVKVAARQGRLNYIPVNAANAEPGSAVVFTEGQAERGHTDSNGKSIAFLEAVCNIVTGLATLKDIETAKKTFATELAEAKKQKVTAACATHLGQSIGQVELMAMFNSGEINAGELAMRLTTLQNA